MLTLWHSVYWKAVHTLFLADFWLGSLPLQWKDSGPGLRSLGHICI